MTASGVVAESGAQRPGQHHRSAAQRSDGLGPLIVAGLLLRQLGLSLPAIAEVLAGQQETAAALRTHLELLEP